MQAKFFYITLFVIVCFKITTAFFIPNVQTWEDYVIAENILKSGDFYYLNDGAVNHSFQFPVYPILLSIALWIYHAPLAGIILNILLSTLGCLFLQRNLKILQQKKWINLSQNIIHFLCLIPLLHPAFLFYELLNVHPFTHDFFMLNVGITSLLYLSDESSSKPIEGGIMAGLCVLGRGTFIVFPMLTLVILVYQKAYKKSALALCGMALMISPWILHNYICDDITSLTSTNGKILWKGSLHRSEGGNYLQNGETYYSALTPEELLEVGQLSVQGQNDFFMKKYKVLLSEEPKHVLFMFFIKLKNFWILPQHIGKNYSEKVSSIWFIYRIFNFVFVAIVFILLIKTKTSWFLLVPFILISFLQCWFYFESRHRLLIDPFLFVILMHLLATSNKSLAFAKHY
ncbi:MAG: hypothetical protein NT150_16145 [Bacteroidetes bacterium]|nr:hypothetical protein [Bacteroidota bacterium]